MQLVSSNVFDIDRICLKKKEQGFAKFTKFSYEELKPDELESLRN